MKAVFFLFSFRYPAEDFQVISYHQHNACFKNNLIFDFSFLFSFVGSSSKGI